MSDNEISANQVKNQIHEDEMVKFGQDIEKMMSEGLTMIEAISEYCEMHDMEAESIVDYISPNMMKDLTREASEKNLVQKSARLKDVDAFFK